MKIAVTYDSGEIFQHFGQTSQFKIYEAEEGKVISEQIVDTEGNGHGALAGFLADKEVTDVICGGIGEGAQTALAEKGIKLYGGVSGNADVQVAALLEGRIKYNPDVQCATHAGGGKHHAHGEGEHHSHGKDHSYGERHDHKEKERS